MTTNGTSYDSIVVGAGHNGLVCAAFLAKAGRKVLVVESRDVVGGFCTTAETISDAPGFLQNETSLDHILTNIPPSVVDDLDLARFGLRYVDVDPFATYLSPEGKSIRFWRDQARTQEEIGKISRRDAESYEKFIKIMIDFWTTVTPYMQGHPTRPGVRTMATLARRAVAARSSLGPAARVLLSSPGEVIDRWFESEELKAALACYAVSTMASLDEPGSGVVLSMFGVLHGWGLRRPVGGSGAFADALAAAVEHHGGEIRLSTPVNQILFDGAGRANGVETATGERLQSDRVVAAVDPTTLFTKLVPEHLVPEGLEREVATLGVLSKNISGFKADAVLSAVPKLPAFGNEDHILPSCMLLAPSIDYVRRAATAAVEGRLADELPLWIVAPSVLDPTLKPKDDPGANLYVYLPAVPYELADGTPWEEVKDKHFDRCLDVFEQYAPGTKATVVGTKVSSPRDFGEFSDVHRGNLFHVDLTPSQAGPWRPSPSLAGYRTPLDGLWHTGAGAHPLGLLNGWSGRTTARTMLRSRTS